MWVIGFLIALALAALFYGVGGSILSGVLGALVGALIATVVRPGSSRLEARLRTLENTLDALRSGPARADRAPTDDPHYDVQAAALAAGDGRTTAPLTAHRDFASTAQGEAPPASSRFWVWLVEGNALARVGVVVLFVAVAFLLKYVHELTPASAATRLAGIVLAVLVLLGMGAWLRPTRPRYAQVLQGGSLGLLYIAVFGASNLLGLVPGWVALGLLIAIVALAAWIAIAQNAQWLAMLAIAGGFLAPVLAPPGADHLVLLGYYLVLDLGIFAIALRRAWRALNLLGMLFTFGIGSMWGSAFYAPGHFVATEPFLILFFLLYVAIAVVYALREPPQLRNDYVDSALVFGTPLLAFALQAQLVRNTQFGAAWSAAAVSALYVLLAFALDRRGKPASRLLADSFLALGVIFATLTVPLTLDGRWTSVAWALEGGAAYWVGARQGRALPGIFGALLQLAAGLALVGDLQHATIELPILNSFYLGCVSLAAAGMFCSFVDANPARKVAHISGQASAGLFFWGLAWWLIGGLHEISVHAPGAEVLSASLLFFTATCAAFSTLWERGWSLARLPATALLPVMATVLVFQVLEKMNGHPLSGLGAAAWPLAFLVHFLILWRHEDAGARFLSLAHAAGFWLLAAVATWESAWWIVRLLGTLHPYWPLAAWALAPVALLAIVATVRRSWPVARHPDAYLWSGGQALVLFLILWTLYVNLVADNDPFPRPYVPLLNPLDIVQMLAFAVVVVWWRSVRASGIDGPREFPATWPVTAWCVAIFYWANAVLFRTAHQRAGLAYQFPAVLQSPPLQMALSILWTFLALATMYVATRVRNRQMWIVGSFLMVTVVIKLIVVELRAAITVDSVISGIAVGVLMLVAGYLAPIPPKCTGEH
jgi:uncharacterized membrane protein